MGNNTGLHGPEGVWSKIAETGPWTMAMASGGVQAGGKGNGAGAQVQSASASASAGR